MKKTLLLAPVAAVAATALLGVQGASAREAITGLKAYMPGASGDWAKPTFLYGYDDALEINTIETTIKLTSESVMGVLSTKAGRTDDTSAKQYSVYLTVEGRDAVVGGDAEWFPTFDTPYGFDTTNPTHAPRTLEQVRDGLLGFIDSVKGTASNYYTFDTFWPTLLSVYYNDGGTFKPTCIDAGCSADSSQTVGEYLLTALGKEYTAPTLDEELAKLVYGVDYRFVMGADADDYILFATLNKTLASQDAVTLDNVDFVKISYKLDLGIYSTDGNNQVYYPTIQAAIDAGEKHIFINENTVVDGELVIPADVTLEILEGVSLTVEGDGEVINKGTITGAGDLEVDGPIITVNEDLTGRHVVILEGGANHSWIDDIAKANTGFANFLEEINADNAHNIFLALNDFSSCEGAGCAVSITLSNLRPNTKYYMYHHDKDGNYELAGEFTSDAEGKMTVNIEEFSGNVLSTERYVAANSPVSPVVVNPVGVEETDPLFTSPKTGAKRSENEDTGEVVVAEDDDVIAKVVATLMTITGTALLIKKRH